MKQAKKQILETILPTIFGILAVLILLAVFNLILHGRNVLSSPDNGFLKLFVPVVTIFALIIQLTLTVPFWKKFQNRKKVLGLTLIPFTALLSLVSGVIFGLVFWERTYGTDELLLVSLTGIFAFAVYWTVNLLTLQFFLQTNPKRLS